MTTPSAIGSNVGSTAGEGKVAFAHALRGWAAITVVIGHLGLGFWSNPTGVSFLSGVTVPAGAVAPMPLPAYAIWWGTSAIDSTGFHFLFAPFGVGLFFLISGFVIPFAFRRQSRLGFLAGRAVRLWPTYAVGLTLAVLAVWVGSRVTGESFILKRNAILPQYVLGLRDLLWLPSIDGVVWTLEIEVRFYLLCALLAPWLAAGRMRVFYLVAPLVALAAYVCGHNSARFFERHSQWHPFCYAIGLNGRAIVLMFVGVAFHYLHRGWIGRTHAAGLIAGLFGLTCATGYCGGIAGGNFLSLVNAGAAVAFFGTCYRFRDRIRGGGVVGWLADISYPLYAVHGVLGYVVMSLLLRVGGISNEVIWVAGIGSALLAAWAVHVFVEKPTHRLAAAVSRRLSAPASPVTPPRDATRGVVARPVLLSA